MRHQFVECVSRDTQIGKCSTNNGSILENLHDFKNIFKYSGKIKIQVFCPEVIQSLSLSKISSG